MFDMMEVITTDGLQSALTVLVGKFGDQTLRDLIGMANEVMNHHEPDGEVVEAMMVLTEVGIR